MKTHGLLRGILAVGTVVVLLALAPAFLAVPASAGTYYWDSNGATGGAGVTPNGTWGTNAFWSTSSVGTAVPAVINTTTSDTLYFSAGTDAANGTYAVGLNGAQGATKVYFDDGTVTIGTGNITCNAWEVAASRTATVDAAIAGTAFTKTGTGTLILTGSNSFTSTTMSAGTLAVNSNLALGTPPGSPTIGNITLSGGSTLRFDAAMTVDSNRGIALGTSGATLNTQGNNVLYLGAFTGTTALTKEGTGRLELASGMTLPLIMHGGVVRVPASGWTSGKVSLLDPGQANATAVIESSGTFTKVMTNASGITMSGGSGGFAAFGAPFTINLESSGATRDTFIWDHGASHSLYFLRGGDALVLGSTTADNVVEWYDNIDLCGSSGNSLNRLIKVIDNTSVTTDRGKITGNITQGYAKTGMALEKIGNGLLELTGANTYYALTTVTDGTLLINGSLSTSTAAVTVASGATLGGTGTIGRPVTISTGGHLAPGDSPGTLTINRNLSIAGSYDWELAALSTSNPGTDYDQTVLTNALTLNPTVTLTGGTLNPVFSGAAAGGPTSNIFWHSNRTWTIIDNQGTGSLTSTLPNVNYANKGTFSTASGGTGNDLVLTWTSAAAATIGLSATPVDSTIITSGTTTVNVAVSNTALAGAWDLNYAYSTGDGLAGSGSGTKAPGSADNLALTFTGGATGSHGSVNVSDPFATTNPETRSGLVTVLDHSNARFTDNGGSGAKTLSNNNDNLEIDFGTLAQGGDIDSFFDVFAQVVVTNLTAKLDLDLISSSGDTGVLAVIGKVAFSDLAAGFGESYTGRFDTSAAPHSYLATYVFKLSDQNLPGASLPESELLTLTLKGTVMPEPATMALMGLGGLFMGLARMRGRKLRAA
jgi:autotransporter-associated beta strand protein